MNYLNSFSLSKTRKEKEETAWDGSTEILAFSADTTSGLSNKISAFVDEFSENDSREFFAYLGSSSRKTFSPRAQHRLLMVLDRNKTDEETAVEQLKKIRSALNANDLYILETIHHV